MDARDVIAADDNRQVRQAAPDDFAAVVPEQGDGQHASLACLLQRGDDVGGAAARRDRDGHVTGTPVGDHLAQKYRVAADVVRNGGDVRGLVRQRQRPNGRRAGWRTDAVDGPVVGVGGRAAVAEHQERRPVIEPPEHNVDCRCDLLRLRARNLRAQPLVVGRLGANGNRDLADDAGRVLPGIAEERIEERAGTQIVVTALDPRSTHGAPNLSRGLDRRTAILQDE